MHSISPDGGALEMRRGPIKIEAHTVACGTSAYGRNHANVALHQRHPHRSAVSHWTEV